MRLLGSRYMQIIGICAGFITLIALAHGGGECASLGGDCATVSGWDPMAKLDEIGTGNYDKAPPAGTKWPEKSRTKRWDKAAYGFEDNETTEKDATENAAKADIAPAENNPAEDAEGEVALERSDKFEEMLVPIGEISETDVLIDVSENATEFIPGAVALSYAEFLLDGGLRSLPEVAQILGDAGVSRNDSVVIYGECLPCGGGPAASTYIYWMMKSLGHEKIKVMDGTVADWKGLGLPTTNETSIRPATSYTIDYTPKFIAAYDYVKSGAPQIIDARTMLDFGAGSIPGAMNIPYESVIKEGKIKDEAALKRTFSVLSDNRPVVVYTQTGIKASVVWFALRLLGYDAKLYSWQDWYVHEEALKGNSSS
jgi:thiosulfate/3-mercaptopyruvate sulfurtransferase